MNHNLFGQVEVLRLIYVFNTHYRHNFSFFEQLAFLDKHTLVFQLCSSRCRREERSQKWWPLTIKKFHFSKCLAL